MNKGNKVLLTVMAVALLGLTSNVKIASALPINFTGDPITFTGGPGADDTSISISMGTITLGGPGSITFSGGPFTIGAVSNPFPGLETASVAGSGTMVIDLGGTNRLTGDYLTGDISTFGTAGNFNTSGTLNYTSLACLDIGGCADTNLATLLGSSSGGIASLSFQFIPAVTLTALHDLADGSSKSTSYSGTLTVPEPGALILMGAGLIGLFGIRKKFQGNA